MTVPQQATKTIENATIPELFAAYKQRLLALPVIQAELVEIEKKIQERTANDPALAEEDRKAQERIAD
jgi:hypothetical protein